MKKQGLVKTFVPIFSIAISVAVISPAIADTPDGEAQTSAQALTSLDIQSKILDRMLKITKTKYEIAKIRMLSSMPPGLMGRPPAQPPSEKGSSQSSPHASRSKEKFDVVAIWGTDKDLTAQIHGDESGYLLVSKGRSIPGGKIVSIDPQGVRAIIGGKRVNMILADAMSSGSGDAPPPNEPLGQGNNTLRSSMYKNMFGGSRFGLAPGQQQGMYPMMSPMQQQGMTPMMMSPMQQQPMQGNGNQTPSSTQGR